MFAKRLLQKATHHHHHHHHHHHQRDSHHGTLKPTDLDPQVQVHFGIPNTASVLAVDPIQRLLAVGTLDGRIKVIGGDNIEGLLISPKQSPYKYLEFLQNQAYLVGILIDNDIQVWNLESRCITCSLQWESNITSFSVISGSMLMLVGDDCGMVSVLKYTPEDGKLVDMPYRISPDCLVDKTGFPFPNDQPVVGVLAQPCSSGDRILIAYQYGLMILWDVLEAKVVLIKGDKDLHVKGHMSESPSEFDADKSDKALGYINEKEISAICWASSFGSMLAVGYIDGDILLWNIPKCAFSTSKNTTVSCNDVVKLQLSSAEKRLPVIVLHWGMSSMSGNSCDSQLFVYGGSEIGSEEVITVVSFQWSSGMETLKNVRRVDLSLIGSFADMVWLSSFGTVGKNHFDGLFVLTNPGKLQFYAVETLCAIAHQQERTSSVSGIESPVLVPTSDPKMTAAKLSVQPSNGKLSMWLSELASIGSTLSSEGRKWPLTGGICNEVSSAEEKHQTRVYIAGYQDGSVRIWDATSPILSLVSVLEGQVHGIDNAGSNGSVSKLDLCPSLMTLAVGTLCGVVRVYTLNIEAEVTKLHLIKHPEHEVIDVPPRKGPQCRAVLSLVNSPVQSLQFSASGVKLAVGYESGHVAVLDMINLSVLFLTDSVASPKSPIISVVLKTFSDAHGLSENPKYHGTGSPEQSSEELMFTLTKDAKINIIDSKTGITFSSRPMHLKKELTAISMYVLEGSNFTSAPSLEQHEQSNKETEIPDESKEHHSKNIDNERGSEILSLHGETIVDSKVLLCCQNVLRLYQMKSVIQGEDKPICKVKLANTCFWTSILKRDDKVCGLILCYQSGVLEVRSFPELELVIESSLMSVLRWSFRPNMEHTMSSADNGQICLVNGSELAFISVSADETETRFLASLPLLHDKAVAAAADAAIRYSEKQRKQVAAAGILGGIVKGFKKGRSNNAKDMPPDIVQLEEIFSQPVVPYSSPNEEEELDIDDIEIDEPVLIPSTSSYLAKEKTTESDRQRLFEGIPGDTKPRTRTPEEIMAAYRGAEYASAAAENARNKLLERQEKLERISKRTEDLRDGAEDFASLANELVKTMEGRKWWKI